MIHLLDQLTKLADLGKQLSAVKSTEDLYEKIFDLIESIFNNRTAAILLTDSRDNTLRIAASRGYDPSVVKSFRAAPGEGVTGYVLQTGEPQLVVETINDPKYICGVPKAISEIAVPLQSGKDVLGVLDMESADQKFSTADQTLFEAFGEQVVTALRNLQLQSSLEERARKLVTIAKIGQSLVQEEDLDTLLGKIVSSVHEALRLDTAAIQLWDKTSENLVVVSARGYDRDVIGLKVPKGTGVTGKVAEDKRPTIIEDVRNVPDYIPGLENCRSEMAVPLIYKDEVIGVLNVEHKQVDHFEETDLLHATIFADQAAGAIGNARIKEQLAATKVELDKQATRLNLLSETSSKLNAIPDLDALMDEILNLAQKVLGFARIAIMLPEPSGFHLKVYRAAGFSSETEGRLIPVEGSISGDAYSTAMSQLVEDVSKDPRYVEGCDNPTSDIAVPLKLQDDVVGVLNAESSDGDVLTRADLEVLQMLASQVASAVQGARQRADLTERGRRLTMIHKAACALNAMEDPEEMLSTILEFSRKALGFESVAILTPNTDGTHLVVRKALHHGDVEGLRIPIGEGFVGSMFVTGKAGLIDDIEAQENYIPGTPGARCEMAIPLSLEGETIGILDAESMQPYAFTRADLEMFRVFGTQVATALKNAGMIKELSNRARKLTLIHKAACSLNTAGDPDEMLSDILNLMKKALGFESVAILTPEKRGEYLVVRKALNHGDVEGLKVPVGQSFIGNMFVTGKAEIIADVLDRKGYIPGTPGARCEMAVPLSLDGETIGVLDVESTIPNAFDNEDLSLLRVFGSQVVTALNNARMIQELSDRSRKLTLIHRAACSLNTVQDPDEMLLSILKLAQKALGIESVAILTPDKNKEFLTVRKALNHGDVEGLKVPIGEGFTGIMFNTGEAGIIDDVSLVENYIPATPNARCEMAVPLTLEGETIGILDAESSEAGVFTEEDLHLFRVFASQTATALKNAGMIQELSDRAHKLTLIHRAACSLNAIDEPEEMLDTILRLSQKALGFDAVAVLTPDADKKHLTVRKALNHGDVEGLKIPIGQGFVGTMFVTGQSGIVDDIIKHKDYIEGTPGARSEMAVPLSLDGETIGIIDAESMTACAFSNDDLQLFRVFGSQAATALNNARLIKDLKAHTKRLDSLNRASNALNSIHDPGELLDEILKSACDALNLEQCALLLSTPEDGDLVLHASIGYGDALGTRIPEGKGITGRAASFGHPILVGDLAEDDDYIAVTGRQIGRCEMAVPLIIAEKVIGVLDTEHKTPHRFDQQDLEIFASFASQAAIAIHNARLIKGLEESNIQLSENVEEMRRLNVKLEQYAEQIATANQSLEWQIEQLTALHEAGRTITSSLDLDTTLHTILSMSSKIVGSTAGAIKLIDEETKELSIRAEAGKMVEGSGARSILDLPLRIGDRTIGVFELVRERKDSLAEDERQMLETMASQAAIAIENARLFENTQRIYYETLKSLAGALEARDDYTRGHSERVADMAKSIALNLELPTIIVDKIYNAALLHDIGKIGIRDEVLLAPRSLTPEERTIIEQHPSFGNTILMPLKFLGEIREFVRHHHERWDGSGYPDGRKGNDIPLASRIIAVADTFDAMTSSRPYRNALAREKAIAEIKSVAGTQFDTNVVDAFLRIVSA